MSYGFPKAELKKSISFKKILVLGGKGFLGSFLVPHLQSVGLEVFAQTRRSGTPHSCDPLDKAALGGLLRETNPDVVVNLVAETNVDFCEAHAREAFQANVGSLLALQENISRWRGPLIHLSTDQVYGGGGPHAESLVAPSNIYGITKFAAENLAQTMGGTVLRTNFVGAFPQGKNPTFSDWLIGCLRRGEPALVFDDILFSPLHVATLCRAVLQVIQTPLPGIFNVGAIDGLSKAEFAVQLAHRLGLSTKNLQRGSSDQKKLAATRPKDMRMRCEKFIKTFAFPLPNVEKTLEQLVDDYR